MTDSKYREALAEALRSAGVEVGSVGGETFRNHVADRLLASPVLAQIQAEAERKGAARVVAAVEAVERTIANAADQPVEDFTPSAWKQLLYMAANDVRTALNPHRAESEGAAR